MWVCNTIGCCWPDTVTGTMNAAGTPPDEVTAAVGAPNKVGPAAVGIAPTPELPDGPYPGGTCPEKEPLPP